MPAAKPSTPEYPASSSGYWEVKLNRTWEHMGFFYTPGADRTVVNEDTLLLMFADGVVAHVVAAD